MDDIKERRIKERSNREANLMSENHTVKSQFDFFNSIEKKRQEYL
jgi:hypothetical protein